MASWKMAKAFGRAMSERMGKDGKAAKAVAKPVEVAPAVEAPKAAKGAKIDILVED